MLDGLSALVRPGRGTGSRWAAVADWLRALRRRGIAVLLVDAAEPRAVAALADVVLRLERPADGAAGEDLRLQVRLAAARTKEEPAGRRFELRLAFGAEGAAWTRLGDADHRALLAWRLDEDGYSSRQIARRLEVSPATAWRLIRHGRTLPAALRQAAALTVPETKRKPRFDLAALLAARWSGTPLPSGEREGPAAQQREGEGEIISADGSAARAGARPLAPRADARDPLPVGGEGGTCKLP